MLPTNIVRYREGQSYYRLSSGFACYGAMSLPVAELVSVGAAIAGRDLTPPRDALIVNPSPSAMAKLRRLHAAAGQLAEDAPEVIAHPEAARGLEQALIEAMVGCLGKGEVGEDRSALRHHAMILRRFRRAGGGKPRSAALHTRALRGDRGVGPDMAGMLPGAAGDEPQTIPAVAPDSSRAAGPARQCPNRDNRDGDRHAARVLAIRAVRRRTQGALRGSAVHHAPLPAGVATERRINIFGISAESE